MGQHLDHISTSTNMHLEPYNSWRLYFDEEQALASVLVSPKPRIGAVSPTKLVLRNAAEWMKSEQDFCLRYSWEEKGGYKQTKRYYMLSHSASVSIACTDTEYSTHREMEDTRYSSLNSLSLSLHIYLKYAEMQFKEGVMAPFVVLISQPQAEWRGIQDRGGEIGRGKTVAPTATQTGFPGRG